MECVLSDCWSHWRWRLAAPAAAALRVYKGRMQAALAADLLIFYGHAGVPPRWPPLARLLCPQVSLLESRDERMAASSSTGSGLGSVTPVSSPRSPRGRAKLPTPAAEIHLQVATLRESNADYRKFYVHSGTSTLTLRAESKEDRWVWMQALQTRWGGVAGAAMTPLLWDMHLLLPAGVGGWGGGAVCIECCRI